MRNHCYFPFKRVAKEIAPTDPAPQDLDLNDFLFIFWGRRRLAEIAPVMRLNGHDSGPGVNPEISETLYNPSNGARFNAPVSWAFLVKLYYLYVTCYIIMTKGTKLWNIVI